MRHYMKDVNENMESLEDIRDQFDALPYPNIPLDNSPKELVDLLFIHNITTPYYLKYKKIIASENVQILDAGCGSGYKSLVLAEANPKSKIVGVDISEKSVALAKKRLSYYGFENTDFYAIAIEDLPSLGLQFDYINCDDTLYLLPDAIAGLKAMKSVLKPEGILRANLHSLAQRFYYFQAQKAFKILGFDQSNLTDEQMELISVFMDSLSDATLIKAKTWNNDDEKDHTWLQANYLLSGDKGFCVADVFRLLETADLEFLSMTNWQQWELSTLFRDIEDLPIDLLLDLSERSLESKLSLFELLNPIHRLLDFWCVHPGQAGGSSSVDEWAIADWSNIKIHLHPQLHHPQLRQYLQECIAGQQPFEISRYLPSTTPIPIILESHTASCLLPLWAGPQTLDFLTQEWVGFNTGRLDNSNVTDQESASDVIKDLLTRLHSFLYVLTS
jgi:2-polyprenyl-3-methyl-5-hydroxy-6-metoxy-1,4-benzoquinol methylase